MADAGLSDDAIPDDPNASTRWSYPYTARRLLSMAVMAPLAWVSTTTAVSRSPAAPMAGSTRTAPVAYTSTTSLPVTKRAMSKSWMVMSQKMPPDTSM